MIDIANSVRAAGMKFGLWLEPERANVNSDAMKEHPEFYLPITGDADNYLLDFANPDAVDWMLGVMLSQQGLIALLKELNYEVIEGVKYYWISYKNIEEQLPFLGLGKRSIMMRMHKLRDLGILSHYTKKEGEGIVMHPFEDLEVSISLISLIVLAIDIATSITAPIVAKIIIETAIATKLSSGLAE